MTDNPLLTLAIAVLLPIDLLSQKEGDQWVIGDWGNGDTDHSVIFMDFGSGNLVFRLKPEIPIIVTETSACISKNSGDPLLWTNGMQIMGKGEISVADTIAYPVGQGVNYWEYYYYPSLNMPLGFPYPDGALILPLPGSEDEYSVFYHSAQHHSSGYFLVDKFLEARVRYDPFKGEFTLLYKDRRLFAPLPPPFTERWFTPTLEAVRHANGRDWWMITFAYDSDKYFVYLFDLNGIHFHHEGTLDSPIEYGLGQMTFSKQGNYFARLDAYTTNIGQSINLFQFDRCNGTLAHLETINTELGVYSGIAFSPSEQYLFADNNNQLWQWDLWASDISSSMILIDTFDGFTPPGWFGTVFGPMVLAPDGRIYLVPATGSSKFIHVIEKPNLQGTACKFGQHVIKLPVWNQRSAPNIPNFRLGPVDGSPCDTLGLDNHPVSWWRYEEDIPGFWKTIRFTDLSYFEPDTWHWDFDDGYTSEEPNPKHSFDPGLYQVCLTVSNEYASDSSCHWIEILTTDLYQLKKKAPDLSVIPNPFVDDLIIRSGSGSFRTVHLKLLDIYGRVAFEELNAPVPATISLPSLLPGVYFCTIKEKDGNMISIKVVKAGSEK